MRRRQTLVAGIGVVLTVTTGVTGIARAAAVARLPAVTVPAAPRVTAAPLTQVAGFWAIWDEQRGSTDQPALSPFR